MISETHLKLRAQPKVLQERETRDKERERERGAGGEREEGGGREGGGGGERGGWGGQVGCMMYMYVHTNVIHIQCMGVGSV